MKLTKCYSLLMLFLSCLFLDFVLAENSDYEKLIKEKTPIKELNKQRFAPILFKTSSIRGRVIEKGQMPLSNVKVTLSYHRNLKKKVAWTNEKGEFVINLKDTAKSFKRGLILAEKNGYMIYAYNLLDEKNNKFHNKNKGYCIHSYSEEDFKRGQYITMSAYRLVPVKFNLLTVNGQLPEDDKILLNCNWLEESDQHLENQYWTRNKKINKYLPAGTLLLNEGLYEFKVSTFKYHSDPVQFHVKKDTGQQKVDLALNTITGIEVDLEYPNHVKQEFIDRYINGLKLVLSKNDGQSKVIRKERITNYPYNSTIYMNVKTDRNKKFKELAFPYRNTNFKFSHLKPGQYLLWTLGVEDSNEMVLNIEGGKITKIKYQIKYPSKEKSILKVHLPKNYKLNGQNMIFEMKVNDNLTKGYHLFETSDQITSIIRMEGNVAVLGMDMMIKSYLSGEKERFIDYLSNGRHAWKRFASFNSTFNGEWAKQIELSDVEIIFKLRESSSMGHNIKIIPNTYVYHYKVISKSSVVISLSGYDKEEHESKIDIILKPKSNSLFGDIIISPKHNLYEMFSSNEKTVEKTHGYVINQDGKIHIKDMYAGDYSLTLSMSDKDSFSSMDAVILNQKEITVQPGVNKINLNIPKL